MQVTVRANIGLESKLPGRHREILLDEYYKD